MRRFALPNIVRGITTTLRPFYMGTKTTVKNKQKKQFPWRLFFKRHATGLKKRNQPYRNCKVWWEAILLAPPTEIRLISVGRASNVNAHKKRERHLKLGRNCNIQGDSGQKNSTVIGNLRGGFMARCGYRCGDQSMKRSTRNSILVK